MNFLILTLLLLYRNCVSSNILSANEATKQTSRDLAYFNEFRRRVETEILAQALQEYLQQFAGRENPNNKGLVELSRLRGM
jgi:hypothetical protein